MGFTFSVPITVVEGKTHQVRMSICQLGVNDTMHISNMILKALKFSVLG